MGSEYQLLYHDIFRMFFDCVTNEWTKNSDNVCIYIVISRLTLYTLISICSYAVLHLDKVIYIAYNPSRERYMAFAIAFVYIRAPRYTCIFNFKIILQWLKKLDVCYINSLRPSDSYMRRISLPCSVQKFKTIRAECYGRTRFRENSVWVLVSDGYPIFHSTPVCLLWIFTLSTED